MSVVSLPQPPGPAKSRSDGSSMSTAAGSTTSVKTRSDRASLTRATSSACCAAHRSPSSTEIPPWITSSPSTASPWIASRARGRLLEERRLPCPGRSRPREPHVHRSTWYVQRSALSQLITEPAVLPGIIHLNAAADVVEMVRDLVTSY